MNGIAGIALTFMMCLTVADVLLRAGGHPIIGTYEIAALALALVVGFGIPQGSMERGHVYMEFLLVKMSKRGKNVMNTFTRVLCLILFAVIGYNLFIVGSRVSRIGRGFTDYQAYPSTLSPTVSQYVAFLNVSSSFSTS